MPAYQLTAAWQKIASAGQAVEIQNMAAAPVAITISPVVPVANDGILPGALDGRDFALLSDLYARAAGAAPATIEVMGGFALSANGGTGAVPFATALPIVSGLAQTGQTLTVSPGTWTGAPTAYAYQWRRSGTAISGAMGTSYATGLADGGFTLTVTVTATNAAGSATATSVAVLVAITGTAAGGGAPNTADFSDPNNAYLAALAA